ncbi:MAG: IS200/IS605 family transposase, partial [Lentisphaeraceae bacterium]|nr:IS200/IS605 family transposase [Lentisphaeraceae bacterium]
MAQSLSKILVHLVFSTKNREPLIKNEFKEELYAYLSGICRKLDTECYRVGGFSDHIHMAIILPRTKALSDIVSSIKASSSKWMNEEKGFSGLFSWQAGYGAFSLGFSQLDSLLNYIDHQEEHHRTNTFKEELLEFFDRYKVEYNEKYLWNDVSPFQD